MNFYVLVMFECHRDISFISILLRTISFTSSDAFCTSRFMSDDEMALSADTKHDLGFIFKLFPHELREVTFYLWFHYPRHSRNRFRSSRYIIRNPCLFPLLSDVPRIDCDSFLTFLLLQDTADNIPASITPAMIHFNYFSSLSDSHF